ncbi:MAG: 30S ribosomal protein S6e [Candidatus Thermoplasmatota archaeon]|nr:30S ribosomal protein S6e [Candidatus Thermoplasmatota archaeon]MDI6856496.1 30S ribosomal protein S6e [Candidatus Thermoplasmatota archaeon]MDI6887064.1 30S ribosomal protein S6e [Candidatus Thermoplasmatota archaeon]
MVEFKANVSDPKSAKTYKIEVKGHYAGSLIGKKISDEIDGYFLGLPGYKLTITGGSDKDGFPMRKDVPRAGRKEVLLAKGACFRAKHEGVRKKRFVHGNIVSPEIVQLNFKINEWGPKSIEELLKLAEKK